MPTLRIDNRAITVAPGTTVLEAARALGMAIPTLCHLRDEAPLTTCFVCVVQVEGHARLLPACATEAREGMAVHSASPEVQAARRTALELLLSDHRGDCLAPCRRTCPAHIDLAGMLRLLQAGQARAAAALVKEHLPFPAILGRICPAPCEGACRRTGVDAAVSICRLKRAAGDAALQAPPLPLPTATGQAVAVVGAGPAGLTAAYYLRRRGHAVTIYEADAQPGGALRTIEKERLPAEILDAEIAQVSALGVCWEFGVRVGRDVTLDALRARFDAVMMATGPSAEPVCGLPRAGRGIAVARETLQTALPGVFAAGAAVTPSRLAVRAVGDGRAAALAVHAYLTGQPFARHDEFFSVHMGKLAEDEAAQYHAGARAAARVEPAGDGLTPEEIAREASRCLQCDCRKLTACALRDYAVEYGAHTGRFPAAHRPYTREDTPDGLIYESGKCISCGRCVRVAERLGEPLGLAFVGRGFTARVAVPLGGTLAEGLTAAAHACVEACPTGALAWQTREEGA